jgi:tryptophan halogenase
MSQQDISQLLVFGNTLAASMTVLALSKALPKNIKLLWVKPAIPCASDLLYGGISSPEAYQFNLQHGVTEPQLILDTDTTFTFGTRFNSWGINNHSWMQCFHLPFTATSGVELHHFMTRHNAALGDFLISAQAAINGTFAHPPTDNPQSPLSRAEYGYHFDPIQWSAIFYKKIDKTRVNIINGNLASLKHSQDQIDSLQLDDGTKLQADLYIDCSGTSSQLLSKLNSDFVCQRTVQLSSETQPCAETGPAYRLVTGTEHGWQSVTPLRQKNHIVSLFESSVGSSLGDEQVGCQTFALGYRDKAWQGNCVAIGHAAYALEPVTPAPYILLKKDIERLLELIPVSHETQIETQEYNRRFHDDVTHAELFHGALYAQQGDVGYGVCEKLDRKLTQYLHRGILTNYDFEPFNQQDWAILHAGLGRIPERYDRMAEQVDFEKMQVNLDSVRRGIAHLASKMPPHHIYLNKLSMYLRESEKHGK